MFQRRIVLACVAVTGLFAVSARAGMITANFTDPDGIDFVNFSSSFPTGQDGGSSAAIVDATRVDTPGPGVDTLLPTNFRVYCVEVGQDIYVPQVSTFANVIPLSDNPTTNPGNDTGPVTFDPTRVAECEKLFGAFYPNGTDQATNDAFQLALWDIVFSDNLSLVQDPSDPNDRMWVDPPGTATSALAQTYLDAIANDTNNHLPESSLVLLTDPVVQDQLALVPVPSPVPEPVSLGLILPAGLLLLRRRKACL